MAGIYRGSSLSFYTYEPMDTIRVGRRCSIQKLLLFVSGFLVSVLLLHLLTSREDEKWYYKTAPCEQSPDTVQDMLELTARLHKLFDQLEVRYFLCYGSLWGAMRREASLPWDDDIDFCAVSEDLSKIEERQIYRHFHNEMLGLQYNSRYGVYHIRYGNALADLTLFEFSSDRSELQRVGWENRLFSNYASKKFPVDHVIPGENKLKFNGHDLPAPNNPTVFQKRFYPDDWWREVKPKSCL